VYHRRPAVSPALQPGRVPMSRVTQSWIIEREREDRIARSDGYVLLAAAQVSDRICVNRCARLEMP
jgi:hypothetical protein